MEEDCEWKGGSQWYDLVVHLVTHLYRLTGGKDEWWEGGRRERNGRERERDDGGRELRVEGWKKDRRDDMNG